MNNSSIDPDEVDKFSQLSEKWWDTNGEFKMLHLINPLRIKFITKNILQHFQIISRDSPFKNLEVLDVGCGGGLVSVPIAKLGANITAIDASSQNITAAINHSKNLGIDINYLNSSEEELLRDNRAFDVVLCLEVIEHVVNIEHFVSNLCKLVKCGGLLITATINRNIKSYLQVVLIAEYILKWVPKNTHDYSKFLKPSELNIQLTKNHMTLNNLAGLKYAPMKGWYLDENVDTNYFACAIKNTYFPI